jgi:hypothetical protein
MRREFGIKSISTKWVKRKYAFGADGVPEGESDYLKVVYDFHGVLDILSRPVKDSPDLTQYRTRITARAQFREHSPYLWDTNQCIRIVCVEEKDYGALLASHRTC